jgi:Holliday junction resolvasome RuvABC ATP-dependent DNA helicase subunit
MNIKTVRFAIQSAFSNVIGQTVARERISDILLGSIVEDGFIAPTLFVAPPGLGKSKLLGVVKSLLKEQLGRRVIYFRTGKSTGSPSEFLEEVLIANMTDKNAVLIIDEYHEAVPGVKNLLREMLETTTARETQVVKRGDLEFVFNPQMHSVFLATNRVDEVDPALLSRMERVDLVPYCDDEMEGILFQGLEAEGIQFHDNTLRAIAECNRGSARDIIHWINAIRRHIGIEGKKTINKDDVREIIRKRESFPRGVTKNELRILRLLIKHGELQMKELASMRGCSPQEQNADERYLLSKHFMTIEGKRRITSEGREYVSGLMSEGFIKE